MKIFFVRIYNNLKDIYTLALQKILLKNLGKIKKMKGKATSWIWMCMEESSSNKVCDILYVQILIEFVFDKLSNHTVNIEEDLENDNPSY